MARGAGVCRKFLSSASRSSTPWPMSDSVVPRLSKKPFFIGAILLLALAWFTVHQARRPMGAVEVFACIVCVALGAWLGIWPFVLEYRAAAKLVETGALTGVISQIQNLEQVAERIDGATARWQTVQESADKTAGHAKQIAEGMASEVKAFNEFIQNASDSEKAAMRLEVDKLRRVETEWLHVLVRILDHVHALNRAAAKSGQSNVIEQLGRFQNACHDAARRVGLTPFTAATDEKFDGQRHQVASGQPKPVSGALVDETMAAGFTFQGKLLRPVMVRVRNGDGTGNQPAGFSETETTTQSAQNQLPLS